MPEKGVLVHPLKRWWQQRGNLATLAILFLAIPLASRHAFG